MLDTLWAGAKFLGLVVAANVALVVFLAVYVAGVALLMASPLSDFWPAYILVGGWPFYAIYRMG